MLHDVSRRCSTTDCIYLHTPMNWFQISYSLSLTDIDASVCLSICRCECEWGFLLLAFEIYSFRIVSTNSRYIFTLDSFGFIRLLISLRFTVLYTLQSTDCTVRAYTRVFFGEKKFWHTHTHRQRKQEKTTTIFARLKLSLWFPNQANARPKH